MSSEKAKRFVLLGTQRTGTTLVATSLDAHPEILCYGEVLKKFRTKGETEVRDSGYLDFRYQTLGHRLGHYFWRQRNLTTYLDSLYESGSGNLVGFKLMLTHLRYFPSAESYLLEHSIPAINIIRRNTLKTLISRLGARASGVFHSTEGRDRRQVTVPIEGLLDRLGRLEAQSKTWERKVGNRLPFMQVVYEDFVRDRGAQSERMTQFLGIAPGLLQTPLKKLTSDDLSQVISNFEDVRAVLLDTPFERYLDS